MRRLGSAGAHVRIDLWRDSIGFNNPRNVDQVMILHDGSDGHCLFGALFWKAIDLVWHRGFDVAIPGICGFRIYRGLVVTLHHLDVSFIVVDSKSALR